MFICERGRRNTFIKRKCSGGNPITYILTVFGQAERLPTLLVMLIRVRTDRREKGLRLSGHVSSKWFIPPLRRRYTDSTGMCVL